jgi:energy-converting hydrogenase Eha subunit E
LLMLFFWIGFIPLKSFSLRTFLASIFGILVPWFFYLLYSFYYLPNFSFADAILSNFKFKFVLLQLPINQIVYLSGLALVLLVSLAGLYSNLQSDSIQTRSNIRFISIFSSGVLLLFLLFNQYYVVLAPIFIFSLTFLLSHPFSLRKSNFFSIIFIIFVLVNILYFLSIILLLPI